MAFMQEVPHAKAFVIKGQFYSDILYYNSSIALHFWSAGTILVVGENQFLYFMRNSRSFLK